MFTDMMAGRCKTEPHYDDIKALVAAYPWFSAAQVLLLRHYAASGNREREAELRARLATVLHACGRYAVSVSGGRRRTRGQAFVEDVDIITPDKSDDKETIKRFMEADAGPIRPDGQTHPEADLSSSESVDEEVVSETLAEIYAAQGMKERAAELYRKLCLKYPEKSAYFATRIVELGGVPDEPADGHLSDERIFESDGVRFDGIGGDGVATDTNPLGLVWDDLEPIRFDNKNQ